MNSSVLARREAIAKNSIQQSTNALAKRHGLTVPKTARARSKAVRDLFLLEQIADVLVQLVEMPEVQEPEPKVVAFPEGFPEAELLIDAGFIFETVPTTREGLEAIDGIGPKKAEAILEALNGGSD